MSISPAAASAIRWSCPALLQVPRATTARQRCRPRKCPSLWPKTNQARGKSSQERQGKQPAAAALPTFLCQIPWGAPQTFCALEPWVTGQTGVSSSAAGAAGSAPSILLGHFCRLGLCPAWDAGREGNAFGLSPVRLKHSLYLACCGHAQRHPMHPQPAGVAALPASEVSCSLVISEHAQTVRPLKQSHTLSPSH